LTLETLPAPRAWRRGQAKSQAPNARGGPPRARHRARQRGCWRWLQEAGLSGLRAPCLSRWSPPIPGASHLTGPW